MGSTITIAFSLSNANFLTRWPATRIAIRLDATLARGKAFLSTAQQPKQLRINRKGSPKVSYPIRFFESKRMMMTFTILTLGARVVVVE